MLPERCRWVVEQIEPGGDPQTLVAMAQELEAGGNPAGAATAYDRAYGLDPGNGAVAGRRAALLDRLAVTEHGIHFRYVPGGPFLMGQDGGEPDEAPRHPVWLQPYWLAETPLSWSAYCRLMDWEPPPTGTPRATDLAELPQKAAFLLHNANKIRLQYCEDRTTRARDWHAHIPERMFSSGDQAKSHAEVFGTPPRDDPLAPWAYDVKPMVAASWHEALEVAGRLSTPRVRYGLPTEAQWEKAARGGLVGARYPWGDAPPTPDRCDYHRFRAFSVRPMKTFAPNGYGLYAMSGGVWEWTSDWYDRDAYRHATPHDPTGPEQGEEKVLRGGSWADCAEAVTVTYRTSRKANNWRQGEWSASHAPNLGFRLSRVCHEGA